MRPITVQARGLLGNNKFDITRCPFAGTNDSQQAILIEDRCDFFNDREPTLEAKIRRKLAKGTGKGFVDLSYTKLHHVFGKDVYLKSDRVAKWVQKGLSMQQ
ncbi:MAG: hypothetical protein P4M11_15400 [Candidatus Pacebacteria bacterium]|nr:hypothetical protein [Candidatus Paceibacterota bacterium]